MQRIRLFTNAQVRLGEKILCEELRIVSQIATILYSLPL